MPLTKFPDYYAVLNLPFGSSPDVIKKNFLLPQERLIYTTSMTFLARRGLLRAGFRRKDRTKYTGLSHDIDLLITKAEATRKILVKIPLTVRILCPECLGSNIYCECCNGIGTYKSNRSLQIVFEPNLIVHNRVYEFELSRFRPDKFIHFKKKKLRVRIDIN